MEPFSICSLLIQQKARNHNCFQQQKQRLKLMDIAHRLSLRSSQLSENRGQSLRNSQVSFLNLNDLTRSFINSNENKSADKSEKSLSKLNYKYQRVNNSFRLVQIDSSEKENQPDGHEWKEGKSSQILLTLNSLHERVERLEKSHKFDQQKQQFQLHKMAEKIVADNDAVLAKKMEKKLQMVKEQIAEVQSKMRILSDMPNHIIEIERNITKQMLDYRIQPITPDVVRHVESKCEQLREELENNMAKMDRRLADAIKETSRNIQNKVDDLQNSQKSKVQSPRQVHKCMNAIVASLCIQLTISPLCLPKKQDWPSGQTFEYGIDSEGHIVDSQGYYLIDRAGHLITLTPQQIKKVKEVSSVLM